MEHDRQIENVTFRKPQRSSSLCDISSNGSLSDTTMLSLPNTSVNDTQNNKDLYDKIKLLQEELLSANQEIENLNLENTNLKHELGKCKHVIDIYKKIGAPEKTFTPQSGRKKKHPITPNNKNHKHNEQLQNSDSPTNYSTPQVQKQKQPKKSKENINESKVHSNFVVKPKMCILSTNRNNKMLSNAEYTFEDKYDLCHYLKPYVNTEELLKGLDTKLKSYTLNDFCVIFLGEEDFKRTSNYYEIIFQIRNALQVIQHTNIIICLPTYKYPFDTSLFNCRVETFNNLLYLDVLTHRHAYILDSNLNLQYDYTMFNTYSGSINNRGLRTIFKDLLDSITDIKQSIDMEYKQVTNEQEEGLVDNEPIHNFFLD